MDRDSVEESLPLSAPEKYGGTSEEFHNPQKRIILLRFFFNVKRKESKGVARRVSLNLLLPYMIFSNFLRLDKVIYLNHFITGDTVITSQGKDLVRQGEKHSTWVILSIS